MDTIGVKVTGLKELQANLNKIKRNAENLQGTHELKPSELFPTEFMLSNTAYTSFDELLNNCGFPVESKEDFAAIPDNAFDEHIRKSTKFNSWKEMQTAAAEKYFAKKLGF